MTIHFNRYNLCFYKYTECRDKYKSLYLIVCIYVLYRLLSILLWKMSAIRYNVLDGRAFSHGCYRTLVEYKDSCFLSIFLWFSVRFLCSEYLRCLIRLEKCRCFITCVFICTCAKFLKLYVFSTHCILMIINQSSILLFYISF